MSTRYRLPEALGGGEYEALVDFRTKVGDDWRYRFRIPGVGLVDVPADSLTELKPPLPPEPPLGSVGRCDGGYVHIRQGASWTNHDNGEYATWDAVHRHGFTLLLPAPEPVELPWEMTRHGRTVEVRRDDDDAALPGAAFLALGDADVGQIEVWLSSETRERLIAALTAGGA